MSSVDGTIVATALPTLQRALHTSLNWVGWVITCYQMGVAVMMPFAGRLSDRIGRRNIFLVASVVFVTSSLLCGLSRSIWMLLPLRVLQSVGGGAFMPSASGIVSSVFGKDQDRALGLFSSIFPLGALAGPVIGGLLIADLTWRAVFFVNVPIGLAFFFLALWRLPSDSPGGGRLPDGVGALALAGTLVGTMLAITHLGDAGVGPYNAELWVFGTVAVVSGVAFTRRSRRTEVPFIPMRLLAEPVTAAMNVVNLIWGACVVGLGALVPLYAETAYRLRPISAGTLLTARALIEVVAAAISSNLLKRTGYRLPMLLGFFLISAGMCLVVTKAGESGAYQWLAFASAVVGLGIGISAPAANNASLSYAPSDVGAVSGLRGLARQGGGMIGISVTTAWAARSFDQASALAHAFFVFAALLVGTTPLLFLVPDRPLEGAVRVPNGSLEH